MEQLSTDEDLKRWATVELPEPKVLLVNKLDGLIRSFVNVAKTGDAMRIGSLIHHGRVTHTTVILYWGRTSVMVVKATDGMTLKGLIHLLSDGDDKTAEVINEVPFNELTLSGDKPNTEGQVFDELLRFVYGTIDKINKQD